MTARLRAVVRGAVQGVGFRPFVYRTATAMGLAGWVRNSSAGVVIEVEGEKAALDAFLLRLAAEKPPRAVIQSLEFSFLDPSGYAGFAIRESDAAGPPIALVLPDIATCEDCRAEIFDPGARRHRYPFTNCTHCGPRFTIIEAMPYDRAATAMKVFPLCAACRREYEDPSDRRFHAQPIACPDCGPQLALWEATGRPVAGRDQALAGAARALAAGEIVGVKGLGGFHLMVDALNERAVERLRARKHREEKPFALLYPDLATVRADCAVSPFEERLLLSPEAPIVLLARRDGAGVAAAVAPRNPYLGVMLPANPLHHLLMRELGRPVVATSGNLADEPIATDEHEALARLGGIADLFLVHDRPIVRHVDDSIVRVILGRELVLRRARGYAPLPLVLTAPAPPLLAVGAHLKNTVALAAGRNLFLSQHVGDLENAAAMAAFRRSAESLVALYEASPERIVADLHPDYLSTRYARESGLPLVQIQHHHAHVAACMAENELRGSVLGVSWDGTGYGPDGTVWGGEFLRSDAASYERVAALLPFRLPGGERAVREPRRSALGALHVLLGDELFTRQDLAPVRAFTAAELALLRRMLGQGIQSPLTSSAGRLFDAVAALVGLRQVAHFEGQAAMELEYAAAAPAGAGGVEPYPCALIEGPVAGDHGPGAEAPAGAAAPRFQVDWRPLLAAILADRARGVATGAIAFRFHDTLAAAIVAVAERAGEERVVLSGGCFQNRVLVERTVARLEAGGFRPYWHQRFPPNDGGIALGQAYAALAAIAAAGRSGR